LPLPITNEHTARTSDPEDRSPEPHANENLPELSNARPSLFGTWRTSGDGIYEQTERDNIIGESTDMPIPTPVGNDDTLISTLVSNDDTLISTPVVQNDETGMPNIVIDPALLQVTVDVTDTQTNTVEEGDDDGIKCKPSEGRNKRKRMQTADDLAAAEASKYGASSDRRTQPQPRKVARMADELAAAEASKYGASSDRRTQPRPCKVAWTADELAAAEAPKYAASSDRRTQPRPHKVTRTADELAATEALMYGASTNQRRQPRPRKIA
jgi:hypothetical protein